MSRTEHHVGQKRGHLGKEFWSRRPGSNACGCGRGRVAKDLTHRAERREARRTEWEIAKALEIGDATQATLRRAMENL